MHKLACVQLDLFKHMLASVWGGGEETGFIGSRLGSREEVVEIESYSNQPDCRIQLLD